jgi:predicted TIM-barrel fold metal-dependent hydrolase
LSKSPLFISNIRELPKLKLTFDLCVLERQLPLAVELVRACPDTQFILDHCGVPDVKSQKLDPWREQISMLASCHNLVACKISGLVAYADATTWTPQTLKPYVEHAIEAFGWDRVIFGSDWPVCTLTTSLSSWVGALQELVSYASVEEQTKLFSANAMRVYRI